MTPSTLPRNKSLAVEPPTPSLTPPSPPKYSTTSKPVAISRLPSPSLPKNSSASPRVGPPAPPLPLPSSASRQRQPRPSADTHASVPPMDTNWTTDPLDDPPTPPDGATDDPPDSSGEEDPQNYPPPPPLSQDPPPLPQDAPPSSQGPPQNSPPPPASSISPMSPPPPLSSHSTPSPSPSRSPPHAQPPGLLVVSPPSPNSTSLVPPGVAPAASVSTQSHLTGGVVGDIAIGLVSGYVLLGIVVLVGWWFCRSKKKVTAEVGHGMRISSSSPQSDSVRKMRFSPANDSSGSGRESKNLFSYEELARATSEFSEINLLGEGGFGSVFKGCLPDGREVAVKELRDGGAQGEREFRAEVETISRIHHRHLVSLIGYCIFDDKRLLVYDYVPNNTLHFHLHEPGNPVLDWSTRIKIATGAARGIAYLHEDCHPRIVHRDIKSSNILLHDNFEAQVSDFGLARLFSELNTHVTTRVMGTFGYMAPEYASSGILTEKSDVFSFGVVLLELITGRKPVDTSQSLGDESLVEWGRPMLNHALEKEEFEKLVDPRLEKNYVASEMFRVIEAAAACVRYSAPRRPKMSKILRAFDDMSPSDTTNEMEADESEINDSARKSAEMRLFRRMAFGSQDYSTTDFIMLSELESEEK